MSLFKYGSILSMVILFIAIYFKRNQDTELREQLDSVLNSLRKAEHKAKLHPRPRVAIGLGACLDGVIDAVPLLEELNIEPPPEVKHYGSIEGKKELSETFAFFFSKGAAGE